MPVDETEDVLIPEQQQRIAALKHARAVLVERGALSSGRVSSVVDLVTVAQWILDGNDPWPPDESESDVDAKSNPDEESMIVRGPDGRARYTLYPDRVEEARDAEPSDELADEGVQADR